MMQPDNQLNYSNAFNLLIFFQQCKNPKRRENITLKLLLSKVPSLYPKKDEIEHFNSSKQIGFKVLNF